MLDDPKLSARRVDRDAVGVPKSVSESFGQHGCLAHERIVLGNRAVRIDARHAPRKVAKNIRVGKFVLHAIHIRSVKAEAVGAADEERAIRRKYDAAIHAIDQHLHVLEPLIVLAKARAGHALRADGFHPAFGERQVCHAGIEIIIRPDGGIFSRRRREIAEIDQAILREIRIQLHVMQALRRHYFHVGYARNGHRKHAVHPGRSHGPIALGDQKFAIRKERERPRPVEPLHHRLNL